MNENDVITALECCLNGDRAKSQVEICLPCPYFHEGNCTDLLKRNALDLIRRQQAEIKDLKAEVEKQYEQAQADVLGNMSDGGTSCHWCIEQHRVEAIKEFAERLKAVASHLQIGGEYDYQIITINSIDYLVKEMTEDKK